MLEQHLVAHKIDRRYICDICGAGLKRKEHLERHKLGHNPERPYVCEVCSKGKPRGIFFNKENCSQLEKLLDAHLEQKV